MNSLSMEDEFRDHPQSMAALENVAKIDL